MTDHSSHDDLPSLLRRSHIHSVYEHDERFENRNSEDVHRDALAAAQAERDRVRHIAVQALALHEMREEQLKLRQKTAQESERVRLEHERAMELVRIRELENKARSIPKPPPRLPTPPPRDPTPPPPPVEKPKSPAPAPQPPVQAPQPTASIQQPAAPKSLSQQPNPFKAPSTSTQPPAPTPQPKAPESTPKPQPPQNTATPSHVAPDVQRYLEIHQSLKVLRKHIVDAGKQDADLKKKTGEMRRSIRQSLGQLTGEKGANRTPVSANNHAQSPELI